MNLGAILDSTEITPSPPKDKIGTIWSSFPEYMCKFSRHSALISAIWDKLPLASLMATIFEIFESSKHVWGVILTPVLLGTL